MKKLENIIAENLLRFGVKNLSENDEQRIKKLSEQEEEPGTVTKTKSIGFKTDYDRNKVRGVGKGGAMGGVTYQVTKEKDVDLISVNDMLNKMSIDLAESEQYKKLPIDVKNALAEGYYNILLAIINGDGVSKLSGKEGRDLRKFFRKSQRWQFVTYDLPENISDLKYKIAIQKPDDAEQLKQASEIVVNLVNNTNLANSAAGTIGSEVGNILNIDSTTGELDYFPTRKKSLTTVLTNIEKGIAQKKTKDEETKQFISAINLTTPVNTEVFAAGKFNVAGAVAMVENIKQQIFNTNFTIKYGKGSKSRMESGKDIIAGGGKFKLNALNVISSASNYWQQKSGALDYSHENNGEEKKSFDQVNGTGDSGKNKELANRRNEELQRAFLQQLAKIPYIDITGLSDYDISKEIRVTNTGGTIDEKRDKSKYPNPGQYAQISLQIAGEVETYVTEPAKYSQSGSFKQFGIKLNYMGKKETERELSMSIVTGGKTKAAIVKDRPLKDGLANLGDLLSGNAMYTTNDDGEKIRIKKGAGLSGGSDQWQARRQKQWQKKVNPPLSKGRPGGY